MKKKKLFAFLLTVVVSATVIPGYAEHSGDAELMSTAAEYQFEDRNRMTDEEFFGKWDSDTEEWEIEPELDYNYNADMNIVGDYVKAGDYENAKECLFYYFRNRELTPELPTSRSALEARVSMEGIHKFESPVAGILSVGKTPKEYSVNVTTLVKSNVSCFLIHSLKRESEQKNKEEIVSFNSKESGIHMPVLEIQQGNKITRIPVEQDMYIRGGDFAGENYGVEDTLLVSEGGAAPNDNGTRQAHIKFDISELDMSNDITRATLKLYGSSTADDKEVAVFSGVENQWDENIITYSNLPIRVASWNNIAEGYDWQQRNGVHAQFYNVQVRLNHLPTVFAEYFATKNEAYAVAAIKQVLDFIGDNGGLLYDLYTKEAALNAAFRGDPQLPRIFSGALACDGIINATAFTAILKLIWQDATGLTYTKNEWRKHNGQAYQINSLLRYIAYFPEFTDRNSWIGNIDRRVMELSEDLLNEDGGYTEPTSGYDSGVLITFTGLFTLARIANIELPDAFKEIYERFAMAEMNLTMPNGVQWGWGDGGPVQMRQRIYDVAEITGNDNMYYFGTIGSDEQKGIIPGWTSYYLPSSKLGIMRDNWGENAVAAFLRGRTGLSHSHADVNQMLMYAYGRYLLADTGMNSYDARDPYYVWQSKRTESHNTVEINETGQEKSGNVYTSMYTNPRADFYSAESHAYANFPHTRKVAFIKNNKFFIVSDFMKAPDDGSINTFNQTWHNLVEAKPSIDEETKIAKTNYASGANVEIIPVNPQSLTSATLDDGVGLNESNSIRNTSRKKHVSYKIKKSGNAIMNTIIYPFESSITADITTTPIQVSDNADNSAGAFSMILPDGTKAEYYVNFRPEKLRRFDWYDVDAENVFMKYNRNDDLEFFAASNINFLTENGKTFMRSSKKLTDISVSFEGKVANIQTTQNINFDEEYIAMYAPTAVKATVNGEAVPFIRSGDCVVVGNYFAEFNISKNEDGYKYAVVPEDFVVTYPIMVSGKKCWVDLTVFKDTVVTGSKNWDGTIKINESLKASDVSGAENYGTILLDNLKTSKPVCIRFPFVEGRIAVLAGGNYVKAEEELDENSIDDAAEKARSDKPVYFNTNDSSFNYVYDLQNIMLLGNKSTSGGSGPGNSDGSGGSGGGKRGGSSGGGSHIWPQDTNKPEPVGKPVEPVEKPENTDDENIFDDIAKHWAEENIMYMHRLGFVKGKSDNIFDPDGNITRAEFVAIVARMLGIDLFESANKFEDVSESAWYNKAVNAAAAVGIVNGADNQFYPDRPISRGEMAKILSESCKYIGITAENTENKIFTDYSSFADWEKDAISFVAGAGMVNGMPDGSYGNSGRTTRAEAATVLKRMYDIMNKGEHDENNGI